jgi:5'-deoxynucleotidase YfbR-like HD superfamily hydrolase
MSKPAQQLEFWRKGGEVQRYHTARLTHPETVAEHSFGVAGLVWILTGGRATANMLMAALTHDLPEQYVGDIPAPAKRFIDSNALRNIEVEMLTIHGLHFLLTVEEKRFVKLADYFDGMAKCVSEKLSGNTRVSDVWENFREYAYELLGANPSVAEVEIMKHLEEKWYGKR